MMTKIAMGVVAGVALAFAGAASAQAPTHAETGLPFCSATVKDRCIQKVDLKREGKPATVKK
ncbi:MAG: hypothetical protein ACK4Z0_07325 [Sphingomonadaceae bacterium]